MLPWAPPAAAAATAYPLLHASPLPAYPRTTPPPYRPSLLLQPPLSLSTEALPVALSRGGEAFWEEPDDGAGSEYEDEGDKATGKLSFPFPSPFPSSRRAPVRQQDREEQDLRREIELLLTPEEEAILDQNETADVTKISSIPLMDKLLDTGVDIDLVDKDGFTPSSQGDNRQKGVCH